MADAYVIQHAGETAGIVILERGGVRFYASKRTYNGLDGQRFRNLRAARNAVVEIQRRAATSRPLYEEALSAA
jgi:hypothetical protein